MFDKRLKALHTECSLIPCPNKKNKALYFWVFTALYVEGNRLCGFISDVQDF